MFLLATLSQGRKQGSDSILARTPSHPRWSRGLAPAPALSTAAQCRALQVPGPQAKGEAHSGLRTDALLTLRKDLSPRDHWAPDLFLVTCESVTRRRAIAGCGGKCICVLPCNLRLRSGTVVDKCHAGLGSFACNPGRPCPTGHWLKGAELPLLMVHKSGRFRSKFW